MKKVYKLVKKNDNSFQIKDGRKIMEKVVKVNDGWYSCSRVHTTFEDAIKYFTNFQETMLNSFGSQITVEIKED